MGLFNGFRSRTPQLYVDVDRPKVKTLGVELTDVFTACRRTLAATMSTTSIALPHLAGERSGRLGFPRGCADRKQLKVRNAEATWCRWALWRVWKTLPARCRLPLQHVSGGRDQRRFAARREHRRRACNDGALAIKSCRNR